MIKFDDIFVEKQYKLTNDKKNKLIKIYNPNSFDLQYTIAFDEYYDNEIFNFKFHPNSGVLAPKERKLLKYKMLVKEVGNLESPFIIKFKPY